MWRRRGIGSGSDGALSSRRRGGSMIGWEPSEVMAFHAGKLVLPYTELGAGDQLARGEEKDNVTGAKFGRAKVESELAAVGEVRVTVAPSVW